MAAKYAKGSKMMLMHMNIMVKIKAKGAYIMIVKQLLIDLSRSSFVMQQKKGTRIIAAAFKGGDPTTRLPYL